MKGFVNTNLQTGLTMHHAEPMNDAIVVVIVPTTNLSVWLVFAFLLI